MDRLAGPASKRAEQHPKVVNLGYGAELSCQVHLFAIQMRVSSNLTGTPNQGRPFMLGILTGVSVAAVVVVFAACWICCGVPTTPE